MALLWEAGTSGIETSGSAADVLLLAYFPAGATTLDALTGVLAPVPGARVDAAAVPDVDWVARFKESFRAFRAGSFLVVPAWDPGAPGEGRRLVVDPGQAFGTGTHESTRLSLLALEAVCAARPPRRVLDLGTGSGILAVAALLLGAGAAVGIDVDPDALPAARDHVALNRVPVRLVRGDGARCVRPGLFDLVLANISAPLLVERAHEIAGACRPGGEVVLAGLLRLDVPAVRAAWEPLAASVHVRTDGDWASLVVRRS